MTARWLVGLLALVAAAGGAAQPVPVPVPVPITLERIHADPPLAGRVPRALQLSPGGRFVSYLEPSAADSEVLELWVRPLPAGQPRQLATVAGLIGTRNATLTEAEKMALERRRVQQRGITSYQWCGPDDQRVIVPLAGDLYMVDMAGDAVRTTRLTRDESDPERDARCSRSGSQVAYVKRNDLWVQALDGTPARRLTATGSDTVSTGLAEFIAAEELGRFDGYWWSPDGSRLLALEVDEQGVPVKSRLQIRAEGSQITAQRYPAAGENNARVQPVLIDIASGRAQRLALPAGAEYVARAGWWADGTPWLQSLTRDQTRLQLLSYPDAAAAAQVVLTDTDPEWVEVHSDLFELEGRLLSGKPALLWSSERSGRRQLWLLDRVSGALAPLTQATEPVDEVVCASATRIVYAGMQRLGSARELFEVDAAGRTRVVGAAPGAGAGVGVGVGAGVDVDVGAGSAPDAAPARHWRTARADLACQRLLVQASAWGQPPRTQLLTLDGSAPPLPLDGQPPDLLLARTVPTVQPLALRAADGRTVLNAFYLPPLKATAHAGGHAVIVSAYGGPQGRGTAWAWRGDTPLLAHWQRLGFGVLLVENRGMAGRDREFGHAHYRRIGQVEVDDLFAVVRQLPQRVPGVDAARIGLIGWSYGGFLAVRSMLDADTPFAAAVAGAPVVDWTLYDTAYTERYLGLPDGGQAPAYRQAGVLGRAALLSKPLLLMHGTADDNVLFENSLRLMQALQAAGKLFETAIYPGQAHGLAGRQVRLHADRVRTDFFVRHLRP